MSRRPTTFRGHHGRYRQATQPLRRTPSHRAPISHHGRQTLSRWSSARKGTWRTNDSGSRPHGRSGCEIARSDRCCVGSRYLSLLPEASWARHVPSQCGNAGYERFLTQMYHCHVYLAKGSERKSAHIWQSTCVHAPLTRHTNPQSGTRTHTHEGTIC